MDYILVLELYKIYRKGAFMKFIIPQNYNFKNKIFGILDYSTAFLNLFWYTLNFIILNLFFNNWNIKIFLLISLCLPLTLFSLVGFNGESVVYVLKYVIKYLLRPNYIYLKNFNFISYFFILDLILFCKMI